MADVVEISQAFDQYGFAIGNDEVAAECLAMCRTFRTTADDLAISWVRESKWWCACLRCGFFTNSNCSFPIQDAVTAAPRPPQRVYFHRQKTLYCLRCCYSGMAKLPYSSDTFYSAGARDGLAPTPTKEAMKGFRAHLEKHFAQRTA